MKKKKSSNTYTVCETQAAALSDDPNFDFKCLFSSSSRNRFTLRFTYCAKPVYWEVLYSTADTSLPPDFIFEDGEEHFVALHQLETLRPGRWSADDAGALLDVLHELLGHYRSFQRRRVERHGSERLQLDLSSLPDADLAVADVKFVAATNQRPAEVRLLLPLRVDFAAALSNSLRGEPPPQPPWPQPAVGGGGLDGQQQQQAPDPVLALPPRLRPRPPRLLVTLLPDSAGRAAEARLELGSDGAAAAFWGQIVDPQKAATVGSGTTAGGLGAALLSDYVEAAEASVQQAYTRLLCRRWLLLALMHAFGGWLELDASSYQRATFMASCSQVPLLIIVTVPAEFPDRQPLLTLQSAHHFRADGGSYVREYKNYPYSPRWSATELASRLKSFLEDKAADSFMKACDKGAD
eukprot:TRINITY_DN7155_c0_g1_i1.p1 TRINITY_DN7155_c0_g1~~TRINITY_DN7155_c0_g1_i1.p1  ORF type:complete len:408 (-),score=105.81 TRINITY_DN7155_c0_g1_i1:450-1673(-)